MPQTLPASGHNDRRGLSSRRRTATSAEKSHHLILVGLLGVILSFGLSRTFDELLLVFADFQKIFQSFIVNYLLREYLSRNMQSPYDCTLIFFKQIMLVKCNI